MFEWIETAGAGTALAYLIEVTGKSVVVFLLAGAFISVFRKGSAADRHRIWFVALFGVILFPLLTAVLPSWSVQNPTWLEALKTIDTRLTSPVAPVRIPGVPEAPSVVMWDAPASPSSDVPVLPEDMTGESASAALVPSKPIPQAAGANSDLESNPVFLSLGAFWRSIQRMHWTTALFWIWLAGAVAVLAQMVTGSFGVLFLARRATPIRDQKWRDLVDEVGDRLFLTRDVILLRSQDTSMPMTWGGFNPVVLLPAESDGWSDEMRRCVLTHEFAHIKRWDTATQGVAQLACAVYWFNPFVWLAAKKLRIEREKACDAYVVESGTKPSNYAGHLLEIASRLKSSFLLPLGAVAMARPSQLEGRVLAILDPAPRRHRFGKAARIVSSVLVLGIIFPLAAMVPAGMVESRDDGRTASAVKETVLLDELQIPDEFASEPVSVVAQAKIEVPADTIKTKKRRTRLIQAFIKALDDEDADIRRNAAHMLAEMGGEESVAALGNALNADSDERVREQAAWALGEIESDTAVGVLTSALDDADEDVRRQVVWALSEIESPEAVEPLIRQLSVETDGEVREILVWALGELEDERAVAGLAAAFRSESESEIKRKIVWALTEIDSPAAIETLRLASRDADNEVRSGALWALGEMEDVASIPVFREALSDDDPDIRRRAVWALAELDDSESVEALIQAARDTDSEVRRMAIWALGDLEDDRAFDVLSEAVSDTDRDTRRAAVRALGELEDDRAVVPLTEALRSDDREVRQIAAWSLGEIESPEAVDALIQAIGDSDLEVRRTAVWALGELEDERSIDALIRAFGDSDVEIRRAAMRALGEFDDYRVEATMIDALSDSDEEVREYAAHMCSDFDSDRVVEALGNALFTDSSMEVRRRAAWSLGSIGTDAALDILEEALDHEDPEVHKAATWAISRMGYSSYESGRSSRSSYSIGEASVAIAGVSSSIAEVAVSTMAVVADEMIGGNIGDVVSMALEQSLAEVDWAEIADQIEVSLEDSAIDIEMVVVEELIKIVESHPDSRSGREAFRALKRSDHPRSKAYIKN